MKEAGPISSDRDHKTPVLYLAPLQGVTNRVFRQVYFRHFPGFDAAVAPFILSVPAGCRLTVHFKDLLPGYSEACPVIPQILSNIVSDFLDTVRVLAELGYKEVNWNFGCPYPMVTRKGRGAGLLPQPERIADFLDQVCASSPLPVSVKLRLGFSDSREILELMPVFNDHPLARVIIHPRLATQMYEGQVDLEGFSQALNLSRHPVMYNGDLWDFTNYETLSARFHSVHHWMLGRGAISNPFLPARIKGLDENIRGIEAIEAFHDDLVQAYREVLSGDRHVLDKMKEVWSYLHLWFAPSPVWFKNIGSSRNFAAYRKAVQLIFANPSRAEEAVP